MEDVKFGMMVVYPLPKPIDRVYGLVKRIEDLGFDSLWIPDHLTFPGVSGFTVEAWSVLSVIASKTERLKLITGVTDPHRRNPALLAQTASTVDLISNGRVVLGIGAGEGMNLDPFGIKWDKPVSRMIESIEIMRKLWASDEKNRFNYDGKFYKMKKAYLDFKSVQDPIPIYIAANSPRSRKITGRIGDGWVPILESPDTYKEHLKQIEAGAKEARRDVKEVEPCLELYTSVIRKGKLPGSANKFSVNGNVDEVIEKIDNFVKAGVRHFSLMNMGPSPKEVEKIYGDTIIPYFKEK
ncbi:MAG: LLM class flavin-dependent oxidoreductase [Halobacteriota archaeon]|nr:LLM class flavin-dependent oxidoreductase [Halobacteriota archaeon]